MPSSAASRGRISVIPGRLAPEYEGTAIPRNVGNGSAAQRNILEALICNPKLPIDY
jgi:hypothetical protein